MTFFHNTYSLESQARPDLDRTWATVLCALQAADRAEGRRAEIQIGYAIIRMIEEVG